jgi:hypothetical protein
MNNNNKLEIQSNHYSKERDKLSHIVRRLKLKRQTKLICTIDEKWDNKDDLNK